MAGGEAREVRGVGDVLRRPVARAMLPEMVEHGQPVRRCKLADGVEEPVVGAPGGGDFHAYGAGPHAAGEFGEGDARVVRVHVRVGANACALDALEREHRVVAGGDVGR